MDSQLESPPRVTLLRMARKVWLRDDIPRQTARNYVRQWARSVHMLGDRWLLANKIERKE